MLTAQPKGTPYITVFKISTGEEIIAMVTEVHNDYFRVKSPLQMVMTQQGTQLVPFMLLGAPTTQFKIYKNLIIAEPEEVLPEVSSHYESVVTGIALPKKSSIIT